jgi:hypothetical protein
MFEKIQNKIEKKNPVLFSSCGLLIAFEVISTNDEYQW